MGKHFTPMGKGDRRKIMNNKHIAIALILLVVAVMITLHCCSPSEKVSAWMEHMPASWGKYKIDTVANEVGLIKLYPELGTSNCGLSDDDFMKYARDRIDYKRQFQFIVFTDGKPLVGERCLRKAFIFYLK